MRAEQAEAIAQEFGGRLGLLASPDIPEEYFAPVIVRLHAEEGSELVALIVNEIPNLDEKFRVLLHVDDLTWVLENPIEDDEE